MIARRLLGLLSLAVTATALVGCGGDTIALDPVARAASRTADTTSSRFTFAAELDSSYGSFSFHGKGIYDGKDKSGWMNMHFQVPADVQAQLGPDPSIEMIFDAHHGLVLYMRSSIFPGVPTGKWVKMDVGKLAKEEGVDVGALMDANQADPSQALKMLMASNGAHAQGIDRVRGVRTTHYMFRIDLERLVHDNKELKELVDTTGMRSIPAEAWIDAQGRVRRLTAAMKMDANLGTPVTMTITEDLFDFGVHANIIPPDDRLVVDISDLTGSTS
jgi:hypothetical protein